MTHEQVVAATHKILDAIVESVEVAGPLGCPGGPLYAALMHYGVTLDQYEAFMASLVKHGRLIKRGECYFVGGKT